MATVAFPTEFPQLETDRLLLRQSTLDDQEAVFRNFSDAAVVEYLMPPLTEMAQAGEFINAFNEEFSQKTGLTWAVALRNSGKCLGTCSLEIKPGLNAELGFDLAGRIGAKD